MTHLQGQITSHESTAHSIPELIAQANGQPTVAWYLWNPTRNAFHPASLEVIDLRGRKVSGITAFASPTAVSPVRAADSTPRAAASHDDVDPIGVQGWAETGRPRRR
jgi:hypothetical protein